MDETHGDAPTEKRWPVWAAAVLEALTRSPNASYAARAAGIDRSTLTRLIQRDERFAVAVHEAREQALDSLEDSILVRARSGQPTKRTVTKKNAKGEVEEVTEYDDVHLSDTLAMFFLKRWRPEYREAYRIEQSGPNGGPIQMDVEARITDAVGLFEAEVVRLAADRGEGSSPLSNGR